MDAQLESDTHKGSQGHRHCLLGPHYLSEPVLLGASGQQRAIVVKVNIILNKIFPESCVKSSVLNKRVPPPLWNV